MKPNKLVYLFSLILMLLLTSGCMKLGNVATATTQVTTDPDNPLLRSTSIQIGISATPTIMTKSDPTLSITVTPTQVSTTTLSIIPTLSIEDAHARLRDLLSKNGGCRMPCLWGITPGVTTDQDAWATLEPLSSMSDFNVFDFDSGTIDINDELKDGQFLRINLSYLADQDNVYHVSFQARALKKLVEEQSVESIFDSTDFRERLDFYMFQQVLATHGRPSSVLLNTWAEFPSKRYGQGHFKLILLYPEQGIVVQYTTEMRVVGKNVEGCLANAHVEMGLFPEGNVDAFNKQLALTDWKGRIEYYKPIEEATSMSIDDFYQTFRQSTEECLVTPANLWPLPEK